MQTDDWFVPRGFFTKGMGKSSTLDIFITLVKSTWPQVGGCCWCCLLCHSWVRCVCPRPTALGRCFASREAGDPASLCVPLTAHRATPPSLQSGYHKLLAVIAFACLLAVRAINIAVPWAYKRFINRLSEASHDPNDPHTTDSPAERFRCALRRVQANNAQPYTQRSA